MKYPYTVKQTVAALIVGVAGTFLPGCVSDLVPVNTTEGQVQRGFPEHMKLSDASRQRARYVAKENAFLEELDSNIADAEDKAAFIGGIVDTASSPEGLTALGLSPLTGGLSFLSLLAGYSVKRKGDVTPAEQAKEKEASYNKGVEVASALIKQASS